MGWSILDRVMGGFITGLIALIRWWYAVVAVFAGGGTLWWFAF